MLYGSHKYYTETEQSAHKSIQRRKATRIKNRRHSSADYNRKKRGDDLRFNQHLEDLN